MFWLINKKKIFFISHLIWWPERFRSACISWQSDQQCSSFSTLDNSFTYYVQIFSNKLVYKDPDKEILFA